MSHALLQRRASAPAPGHVPTSVREVLRRPGQPLPAPTRRTMEARFGHDFSRVRVHTDATAIRSAREVGAEAWTVGCDIAFGADRWHPETAVGQRLLAHELTHVVQQGAAMVSPGAPLAISDAGEREAAAAETNAHAVRATPAARPSVRRKESPFQADPKDDAAVWREAGWERLANARALWDAIHTASTSQVIALLSSVRGWQAKQNLAAAYKLADYPGTKRYDLRADLINGLPHDAQMVNALALLRHDPEDLEANHVRLGRYLIPDDVRDGATLDLLQKLPLAERQAVEREYDGTFYGLTGKLGGWWARKFVAPSAAVANDEGGLMLHLHQGLGSHGKTNWQFYKCWALLDRDLTSADHVYFNSVGIADAHRESLVNDFQKVFREQGFPGIRRMHLAWDGYIRDTVSWQRHAPLKPWCTDDLRVALALEVNLSPQTWGVISAILKGYEAWLEGAAPDARTPAERAAVKEKEVRLEMQVETDMAAASSGWLHYRHDRERLLAAAHRVRDLAQKRLTLLDPKSKEYAVVYKDYYNAREAILGRVRTQTFQDDQTRAALDASLPFTLDAESDWSIADELYTAQTDEDQLLALAAKYWTQGRTEELWAHARKAKVNGAGSSERPAYNPDTLIPSSHHRYFQRYDPLVTRELKNDPLERGAKRVQVEMNIAYFSARSDVLLADLVKFFGTPGFRPELRAGVVEIWEEHYRTRKTREAEGQGTPSTPVSRFLDQLAHDFEGRANNWLDLASLLDPVTAKSAPEKAAERAGLRLAATRDKWYNPAAILRAGYDAITGENLLQTVEENAARLNYIAAKYRTNPEALAAMLGATGLTASALAARDFELSEAQAVVLKDMQNACAELVATALETALDVVLGVASGGIGFVPLVKSLGVAIAGMAAREVMMGADYQLLSGANLKSLANVVQGFAFMRVDIRKKVADRWSNKTMPWVNKYYGGSESDKAKGKVLAGLFQCGLQKVGEVGISTATGVVMDTVILHKAIKPKDVVNMSLNLLVSVAAGGTAGMAVVNNNPGLINALTPSAEALKKTALFRAGLGFNFVGKQVSALFQNGVGDRTAFDVLGSISSAFAKNLANNVIGTFTDVEDLRRQMRQELQLMHAAMQNKNRDLSIRSAQRYTAAEHKMGYKDKAGQPVRERDPHKNELKLANAYKAYKDALPSDQSPINELHWLVESARKDPKGAGDVVDALKIAVEVLNGNAPVRSNPLWKRDDDTRSLADLQTSFNNVIKEWQGFHDAD